MKNSKIMAVVIAVVSLLAVSLLIVAVKLYRDLEALRAEKASLLKKSDASLLKKAKEPAAALSTDPAKNVGSEQNGEKEPKVIQNLVDGDLEIETTEDPEDETRQCNSIYYKDKLIEEDPCRHTHSTFSILHFRSISSPVIREDWSEYLMRGEGIIAGVSLYVVDEKGKKELISLLTERITDKCEGDDCNDSKEEWLKGVAKIKDIGGAPSISYKFITYKAELGDAVLDWNGSSFEPNNKNAIDLAESYRP